MLHVRRHLKARGYDIDRWGEVPPTLWRELGFDTPPNFSRTPEPEPPLCAKCGDIGWVTVGTPGHPLDGKTIPCPYCDKGAQMGREAYRRYIANSGLPERYQTMTFETFRELPRDQITEKLLAYGAALLFAESPGHAFALGDVWTRLGAPAPKLAHDPVRNSLVLYGEYGTGKTGLAAAVINYGETQAVRELTLYIRVQDLIRAVQKTYDRDYEGESRDALVFRVKSAPLLVIDEFGMNKVSDDRNEIMEEIIRYRCGRNLPFLATTNDPPDTFRKKWDGRIVEVMLESAHWVPVGLPVLRDQSQFDMTGEGG